MTTTSSSRSRRPRRGLPPVACTMALLSAFLAPPPSVAAQAAAGPAAESPEAIRDELLMHFQTSMSKFIALAEAMPAERYTWSPGEGVMEVGHVYMHVARYNYMYPSQNMGAALPAGVSLDRMEAVRDKAEVVRALQRSRDWVLRTMEGMSAAELAGETRLYGRDIPRWAVLTQLVTHMNEHLGQSIAYARMNEVVPPWSR